MSLVLHGTDGVTFNDSSLQGAAASPYVLKNRIINGDMRIDQRNAGASVTPTNGQYLVDRWNYSATQSSKFTAQQNAGSVTPPAGFTNYLGFTSTSAYSITSTDYFLFSQVIEGLNVADLGWGTADAKTVTFSAWVRSSLTGTFGATVENSAANRCYPFSYTISSANTWTQISVTIPGDTTGTWLTTNGVGLRFWFGLGVGSTLSGTAGVWGTTRYLSTTGATSVVGTNGATFYITGVQLEIGTSATPFERRLYGQELALCKRYYQKTYEIGTALGTNTNIGGISVFYNGTYGAANGFRFETEMRASPTLTGYSIGGTSGQWSAMGGTANTVTFGDLGSKGMRYIQVTSGGTVGYEGHYSASAEL